MKKFYKINNQLNYPEVRVLDEKGEQIGILKIDEAKKMAQDQNLDLIEISDQAKPPVVKIIDFIKFKYLEEKKEKEARKKTKETELKEIRFTPFIGEHDLNTRIERVKEFLLGGNLVKITIRFKGAQMAHQEFGPRLLGRIKEEIGDLGREDRTPIMQGRQFVTIFRPTGQKSEKPKKVMQKENDETKS